MQMAISGRVIGLSGEVISARDLWEHADVSGHETLLDPAVR